MAGWKHLAGDVDHFQGQRELTESTRTTPFPPYPTRRFLFRPPCFPLPAPCLCFLLSARSSFFAVPYDKFGPYFSLLPPPSSLFPFLVSSPPALLLFARVTDLAGVQPSLLRAAESRRRRV
eukprot:332033-Hanusia_phi.AAC.1